MSHVQIILDRSGSMAPVRTETVSGINEFVKAQPKGTTFALTQFDFSTRVELDKTWQSVKKSKAKLTINDYVPRGMTPLLDAVGSTIQGLLDAYPKGIKLIVLIVTDGYENASRDFTREKVKDLIDKAQKRKWQVIYLGADIDAYGEATLFGIAREQTMSYASKDTSRAYQGVATASAGYFTGDADEVKVEDIK